MLLLSQRRASHTLFIFFFLLSCRREAGWYHGAAVYCGWIYRLKKCVWQCVCASLGLVLPFPSAWVFQLQPSTKMHCSPWPDGGGPPTQRTLLAAGLTSTCVHFVFFLFFVSVLERLRGKRAARTISCWSWYRKRWYDGLRDAFQSPVSHCVASTYFRDSAGQFALAEGL